MHTDQKLGLLAGVAAVLVAAVVYFNKPLPVAAGSPPAQAVTASQPPSLPPASVGLPDRPPRPGRDDD